MPPSSTAESPIATSSPTVSAGGARLMSIDALRGFDMFWIIGVEALVQALHKVAGDNWLVGAIANQLDHVAWEGFHFEDLIFPLFVFIVGVSIVFSLSRRVAEGERTQALLQVFRRTVILYLFGLFTYDGIAQGVQHIRLLGVLQRIALCYFFASLAFLYLKPRARMALCAGLLVGYWALMTFVPVPGIGAGNFAEGANLANYVDREHLALRRWDGDHDPEGLLSTLPAIAGCLLGTFAGMLLRRTDIGSRQKVQRLLGWGLASVVLGLLWSFQFPIIKKIWTSSFVLLTGGLSAILLGTFYQIIDVWEKRAWATPFVWIGTNAITVYMFVHVFRLEKLAERIAGGEIKDSLESFRPGMGDLLIAFIALAMAVLFCRFLYNRRIFLKV